VCCDIKSKYLFAMKIMFKRSLKPTLLTYLLLFTYRMVIASCNCERLSFNRLTDFTRVWEEWKKKKAEENKQREEGEERRGGVMKRKERVGHGQTSKPIPTSHTNGVHPQGNSECRR
jgi:hypothetical protein